MSAFSLASTTRNNKPTAPPKHTFNPIFDIICRNTKLLHRVTEHIPPRLPAHSGPTISLTTGHRKVGGTLPDLLTTGRETVMDTIRSSNSQHFPDDWGARSLTPRPLITHRHIAQPHDPRAAPPAHTPSPPDVSTTWNRIAPSLLYHALYIHSLPLLLRWTSRALVHTGSRIAFAAAPNLAHLRSRRHTVRPHPRQRAVSPHPR